MSSFFHKLYRYKQSEIKNQKENFITEIFAHCLMNDCDFRKSFLTLIGCNQNCDEIDCQTQFFDKEFGKPDILIKIGKETTILIECKIDALQGQTQLYRYAEFLKKYSSKFKHLIFLTKFAEEVEEYEPILNFKHIRWCNVFELIKCSSNLMSKEFSTFLIEEKMSNQILFNKSEINAIKQINETQAKMDEFLLLLKDILKDYTKDKILYSKKLTHGHYGISVDIEIGNLWLGFYEYENNEEMQICVNLDLKKHAHERENIDKFLELNNWETYDEDEFKVWYNSKNISTFFVKEQFNTLEATDFIRTALNKIKKWL